MFRSQKSNKMFYTIILSDKMKLNESKIGTINFVIRGNEMQMRVEITFFVHKSEKETIKEVYKFYCI